MAWLKIDTGFPRHRKLGRLSHAERWQHLEAMCWCAEMGTDGAIDDGDLTVVWPGMSRPAARRLAAKLVSVGLWDGAPGGGWVIHDWTVYNISSEASKEQRDRAAERKRAWREKRRQGPDVTQDATRDGTEDVTRDRTRSVPRKKRVTSPSRGRPDPTPPPGVGVGLPPTPSSDPIESAAAPPEPEPGAQSPPPEANGSGEPSRVDLDAIAAASPAVAAGLARARAGT